MEPRTAHEIRLARTARERDGALAVRHRVFCEEQGVAPELEVDGRDGEALHLVAVRDGAVVGTCRLLLDGSTAKLGRLAVEADARGAGLGAAIVDAAVGEARRAGARRVTLNAQTVAVGLYERAGFAPRGGRFQEAGIEHVRMDRVLGQPSPEPPVRQGGTGA
ncbi:MAG TPA: GNAT family N-acetyltransferase [Solirubrobacteraceae bacterium]|nr:GNAT family N-acetyltransferase [Solirubrobacteraceae bacterium]